MTLIALTIAWMLGILFARQVGVSPLALGGLTLAGAGWAVWCRRSRRPCRQAVLLLAALLGGWRYWLAVPRINEGHLAFYNDTGWVTVLGHVSADPSIRDTYTQLELSAHEVEVRERRYPVRGKVVLNVAHYPAYAYGDVLRVGGQLETPPVLDDFSYREYLAARGVRSLLRRPEVTQLEGRAGSALLRLMLRLKSWLRGVIEGVLPYPEAGLLCGLLLGLGHTLPDYLADAFRVVGLTHLIVISGYNISLVSQSAMTLAGRFLYRWAALLLSLAAIGLFTLFVGPSPPVARAALMGGLFVGAQLAGRKAHAPTSLAAASLCMTLWDPLSLWSVSFQLSFAATLGLILLAPALERRLIARLNAWGSAARTARWWGLARDGLLVTGAAQLATLPILWYHFQQVSVVSLLANVLVLPVQPAVMALGFAATVGGAVWEAAGRALGWLVWPWLRYTIWVAQELGGWSWAAVEVPRIPALLVWAVYGAMAWWLLAPRGSSLLADWRERLRRWRRQWRERQQPGKRSSRLALVGLGLVVVLVWSAVCSLPDDRLHVYFLDVGQGDAILLRAPGGYVVLVDGGPDPLALASRLGQVLPFWQRRVDLVVATHADQDHLAGLVPVLERYRVGHVLQPATMGEGALVAQWQAALQASGAQVVEASRDTRIWLGDDLCVEVLHPPLADGRGLQEADDNRDSVVLRIHQDAFALLLTADIDAEVEAELLQTGQPLQATLLKVAHHGSSSATSDRFLAAVSPQIAVISVGADNRFGHPGADVLQRLELADCQVFRTDEQGTVEVVTDGQRCWVQGRGGDR
ncbi:MAG: DNA internalization-related competence protein ComEC/Rec2 [Chloroflexi bacterium]|jgi:competence protein ComEC|nr:DNA internalization-related competence protein ComEC/Rec2 [Chloroflexota bacterium]